MRKHHVGARASLPHRGLVSVLGILSVVALGCSSDDSPSDSGAPPSNDSGRSDVVDARAPDTEVVDSTTADGDVSLDRSDVDVRTADGDATSDSQCVDAGLACGVDCGTPHGGPCFACGTLYLTATCDCRAPRGGGACFWPDCSSPAVGGEGDHCGTYWWCDRACAAGLTCEPDLRDGGFGNYLRSCQRRDGGTTDVVPDSDVSTRDADARPADGDVTSDSQCADAGRSCGIDCGGPAAGPCFECGTLFINVNCECRPIREAGACFWPDCSSPAVGGEGDHCGTHWWCDRACSAGLTCSPINLADAGSGGYYRTCQRLDAGSTDVADADVNTADADVDTTAGD
jgi:hypothetical protein